jgi:hypothetical protein
LNDINEAIAAPITRPITIPIAHSKITHTSLYSVFNGHPGLNRLIKASDYLNHAFFTRHTD